MADSTSGARDERIPLQHYKAALRLRYGPGRWRIERDGRIFALSGTWIVFGRVGDQRTIESLFGRPTRQGEILRERWANMSDADRAEHVRRTKAGMAKSRGVVSVELGILLATIGVAVIGGCTTVDNAISQRWPNVTLAEVATDAIVFHAERVAASKSGGQP